MRSLAAFTADLLRESGAVVEPTDRGLEALLPTDSASVLEVPEHVQLSFSHEAGGIPVSFDSDFFKKMARLLGDRGRFSAISLPASPARPEKIEERLEEKVVLHNAVFQVQRKEQKRISYLLAYFKYSARSDDRQEGIVSSMINEFNLSARRSPADSLEFIANNAGEPSGEAERENSGKILKALARAQREIVREALQDFVTSLERRLNRDIHRVHNYYQILIQEHRQAVEKKVLTAEDKERIQSRIEAIERELGGKVQDLIGKYSLNLEIHPISFIRVEVAAPIFWLLIKRRKESRPFPLTYNPILRTLDGLPCEACFYPRRGHSVCDDRLHIVCKQCLGPCTQCGKIFCGACHPDGCPRCAAHF